jgi:hypothetical protein
MRSKIKFAVISCGHIGKRHAERIEALIQSLNTKKTGIFRNQIPNYSILLTYNRSKSTKKLI